MSKSSSGGGGLFLTLLTVLFIALKLTGHITWPWWGVLAPLWIGWLLSLLIIGGLVIAALISGRFP